MAKRKKSLVYRKYARTKVATKNAPALISEKSKVIKKLPVKRGASTTKSAPRTGRGRPKKKTPQSNPIQIELETPELIEFKIEPTESPSVFANCDPEQINQEFQRHLVPIPINAVNFSQPIFSSNAPSIHSQTTKSNPVDHSQRSTQCTESQVAANGDNYLLYMLQSDSTDDSNKMVDCGIQCAIRDQCDVSTSTSPMTVSPSEFDLLDLMFLNQLSDRLNIDRGVMIAASENVLAEIKRTYDSSQEEEDSAASFSESIFGQGSSFDFRHDNGYAYSVGAADGAGDTDDIFSSPASSIISASPQNFDSGF